MDCIINDKEFCGFLIPLTFTVSMNSSEVDNVKSRAFWSISSFSVSLDASNCGKSGEEWLRCYANRVLLGHLSILSGCIPNQTCISKRIFRISKIRLVKWIPICWLRAHCWKISTNPAALFSFAVYVRTRLPNLKLTNGSCHNLQKAFHTPYPSWFWDMCMTTWLGPGPNFWRAVRRWPNG